jgi:hypothetical protein
MTLPGHENRWRWKLVLVKATGLPGKQLKY